MTLFRRNILEVLYDFRHTTPNIPPDYLFDLIPAIKQRSFSIASSPTHHQAVLELLVAVVNYRTNLKSPRWEDVMALISGNGILCPGEGCAPPGSLSCSPGAWFR